MRLNWMASLFVAMGIISMPGVERINSAFALNEANVLVLYNSSSTDSLQIANYYAQVHPDVKLLGLNSIGTSEEIYAADYLANIRNPVLSQIQQYQAGGVNIDCIVTTKGLPLRIINPQGTVQAKTRYSSLESELAWLDSFDDATDMAKTWTQNPYYYSLTGYDHSQYQMRLTSRLDGFTVSDVEASIDRAQQAVYEHPGYRYIVDDAVGISRGRMASLCNYVLSPFGQSFTYDKSLDEYGNEVFITEAPGVVTGYVSHGVHGGGSGDYVVNGLSFYGIAPGAVFHTYESFNAYTFNPDAISSMPARQGLVAEWISIGGTAGTGNVQEPGTDSTQVTNEDIMFYMLLQGYNWAEAAWSATYQVSYVNTVVGDPLMTLVPWFEGDADFDGNVDTDDLINWLQYRFTGIDNNDNYWWRSDYNGDGIVDVVDLNIWKTHKFTSATYASTSPEPATLSLLLMAAAVLIVRKGQK